MLVGRDLVLRAFDAALNAVDARRATHDALLARRVAGPVHVIALGKAALAMTAGVLDACDVVSGLAIAPLGGREIALPSPIEVQRGSHPIPDADVARRGEAMMLYATRIPEHATALVLVSGGGSALVDAPIPGVSPDDLASMTQRLLACGASIEEINAVRVGLSRSKGGGLARAIGARRVRAIVVSDIVDGDASQVASGPMSPWLGPSPEEVAVRAHLAAALGSRERAMLSAWTRSTSVGIPLEVVADNARAVNAALVALRLAGRRVEAGPSLAGEARDCGRAWADAARTSTADALVAGGETVVTVRGRGRGGRSQETALAALDAGILGTLLCAGTDGIDGPTDAAGAVIDDDVRARADRDALRRALDANDSSTFFAACGGRLVTGSTGTNVADLAIWAR